jgi:hypothetical protein
MLYGAEVTVFSEINTKQPALFKDPARTAL